MKRLQSFIVLMLLAVGAWAQQISEEQARERALQYLHNNSAAKARGMAADKKATTAKVEAKGIYAFNLEDGGYVIASGDSRTLPVLGYSATGTIDWEKMPANMRAFLKSYDAAIATLGDRKDFVDGDRKTAPKTRAAKAAIAPLVKTHWDQDEPYWNKTPIYDGAEPDLQGEQCLTGCVATAMAQLMNYYQWPKTATKPIPAYDYTTAYENQEKVVHIDALPATTFNWDNMLDDYVVKGQLQGNAAQRDAVATLMRYCGQSVYMYYTPEFSGSDHQQVVEALVKYFGYKNTVRWLKHIQYSIDEWEDLVYNELANGHPVQYGGNSDDGGHSFICDGYDGNGLFHINWGWSGGGDDYFSLAVLNPYNNSSAGAGSSGIGFCIQTDAIFGMEPDTDGTSPQQVTPQASLYEFSPIELHAPDSVYFHYSFTSFSYGDEEVRVDYALGTIDHNGALTPVMKGDPSDSIVYNFAINSHLIVVDSTALVPGQSMRLYPMVKYRSIPGADWQLLGAKEFNVVAGRMPDGRFYLYREIPELEITKMEITKGLGRIGLRSDVTLTIHNPSNIESTVPLVLIPLYYGKVKPADITDDTPYSEGDALWAGGYIRAAQDSKATFCFKPLASGTVGMLLAWPDGTIFDYGFIEVSDVVGSYDDFLVNDSYLEETDDSAIYHVNIIDNTEANIPDAKPSDKVYFYARISSYNDEMMNEVRLEQEAVDYLKNLPTKAGDGTYALTYDLPLEISRGGLYYAWSYFNEWINGEKGESISSAGAYDEFVIEDDPAIRVIGETSLASGQSLLLKIQVNTGYPYNPENYTGNETLTYSVYNAVNGEAKDLITGHVLPLHLENGDEYLAQVDSSVTIKGNFADGEYILRFSTDAYGIPARDVLVTIGGSGINTIVSDNPQKGVYTNLKGIRTENRPNRKGVYIRNGRKEIVR